LASITGSTVAGLPSVPFGAPAADAVLPFVSMKYPLQNIGSKNTKNEKITL
jgi:hypothetical protein